MKRVVKQLVSRTLYRTNLYRSFLTDAAVVVAFHRVASPAQGGLTCDVEVFKRYCEFFARYFRVVSLSDLIHKLEKGLPLNRELVITFDDGYQDNYLNAAPILRYMGLPATFFIATAFIGTEFIPWWDRKRSLRYPWMTWDQVQSLHQQGFEIGSHTRSHVNLAEMSGDEAWEELNGSRVDLEKQLSAPISLFAYPYGRVDQITTENRNLVKAAGFRCCCSCFGGVNAKAANPFFLRRVPISQWQRSPYDLGFDLAFHRTGLPY